MWGGHVIQHIEGAARLHQGGPVTQRFLWAWWHPPPAGTRLSQLPWSQPPPWKCTEQQAAEHESWNLGSPTSSVTGLTGYASTAFASLYPFQSENKKQGDSCDNGPPKPAVFLLAWSCRSTELFWQKIFQDGWAKWPYRGTGSCQVHLKREQGNRTHSWRWDYWLKMQAQKSSSNLLNTTFPLQKKKTPQPV